MRTDALKRNILNVAMVILLLFVMNYRFTENEAHEILGLMLCGLFLLHNRWNRRWYGALRKGRRPPRRLAGDGINALLIAAALVTLASGALISQTAFAALGLHASLAVHEIHRGAAYGVFIFAALHLGMHGDALVLRARRWLGIEGARVFYRAAVRAAALSFMGYGAYAAFEHQMIAKLFLERSAAMWGAPPPLLGFIWDHLAIMGFFAGAAHCALRVLSGIPRFLRMEGGPAK